MSYVADPGGIFQSDAHRHVLGHMSHPDDEYGWTTMALTQRVSPSVSPVDVEPILSELSNEGLAVKVEDAWRLTKKGLVLLTGPIANEPPPNADVTGPASVMRATPIPKVS